MVTVIMLTVIVIVVCELIDTIKNTAAKTLLLN
jgi:hypothetical protein